MTLKTTKTTPIEELLTQQDQKLEKVLENLNMDRKRLIQQTTQYINSLHNKLYKKTKTILANNNENIELKIENNTYTIKTNNEIVSIKRDNQDYIKLSKENIMLNIKKYTFKELATKYLTDKRLTIRGEKTVGLETTIYAQGIKKITKRNLMWDRWGSTSEMKSGQKVKIIKYDKNDNKYQIETKENGTWWVSEREIGLDKEDVLPEDFLKELTNLNKELSKEIINYKNNLHRKEEFIKQQR